MSQDYLAQMRSPDDARDPLGLDDPVALTGSSLRLGVDLGQSQDSTALAAVEATRTDSGESAFTIRQLGRLPLHTPYPVIAETIVRAVQALRARGTTEPTVYIDATGVGAPVIDLVERPLSGLATLRPVTILSGDDLRWAESPPPSGNAHMGATARRLAEMRAIRVGKTYLVSRLKALLQTGRVTGSPTDEFKALQAELLRFEVKAKGTRDSFNAASGAHDDLVIALALSVLDDPGSDVAGLEDLNKGIRGPSLMGWSW